MAADIHVVNMGEKKKLCLINVMLPELLKSCQFRVMSLFFPGV